MSDMNYVITYWVPPATSHKRRESLRDYFDLQRRTKARFKGYQTIITNLDYNEAIPFLSPKGFQYEHGIIAKWLGLGQMIDNGMAFPIMMHDHDVFIRHPIDHNEEAICCAFAEPDYISDQILIIPERCKDDVLGFIDRLKRFDYHGKPRHGYGCEVRHEGRFSSEVVQMGMDPRPFVNTPKCTCINLRDLVTFDIQGVHSLDVGGCDCDPIPEDAQAVHGHLNRGPATADLLEWLDNDR